MSEHSDARRAVARRLHPDIGGDPQEYLAAMAEVDERFERSSRPTSADQIHIVRRRRGFSMMAGMTSKAARNLGTRIPRGWPGAQRYGRL